jgi:mono/diheme cytochrome c family protein
MKRIIPLMLLSILTGCIGESTNFKEYKLKNPNSNTAQANFLMGDLLGLSSITMKSNALPYKLVKAAILYKRDTEAGLDFNDISDERFNRVLIEYGFFIPSEITNWDLKTAAAPTLKNPIGLNRGFVSIKLAKVNVELATVGCAACHGGMSYDENGNPSGKMWLGLPNTSINIEGYVNEVYQSFKFVLEHEADFRKKAGEQYKHLEKTEFNTLFNRVFHEVKKFIADSKTKSDAPSPFSNGGPGLTNGVASIQFQFNLLNKNSFHKEQSGFTAVPDLSSRGLRSSLLYDGVYSPPGQVRFKTMTTAGINDNHLRRLSDIVAFFTVPTMGVAPEQVPTLYGAVGNIMQGFLKDYHAPRYPRAVNQELAARGKKIYQDNCLHCHGTYSDSLDKPVLVSFPNKFIEASRMNLDATRAGAVTKAMAFKIAKSAVKNKVSSADGTKKGYVAMILDGIWTTAPYMHNGSVPTLWQFMNPELRPTRFEIGGHKLNLDELGIEGQMQDGVYKYKEGYKPWTKSEIYDTNQLGRSNLGHESPFDELTIEEKKELLEYLKLL